MPRKIIMRVVNNNGVEKILSNSIIIELLKNYEKDWGEMSSSDIIEKIKISAIEEAETDKLNINWDNRTKIFNKKIGFDEGSETMRYQIPTLSLSKIIDEVVEKLELENPEYILQYHSFNDIEKVAIYFIVKENNTRTIPEIFETLNNKYSSLSKRDLLIKYLTEENIIELDYKEVNPIYKLLEILQHTKTFQNKNISDLEKAKNFTGELEYKEYSFPMHHYNTTISYSPLTHQELNEYSGEIREYKKTFDSYWKTYNSDININKVRTSINLNGPLNGTEILQNSVYKKLANKAKTYVIKKNPASTLEFLEEAQLYNNNDFALEYNNQTKTKNVSNTVYREKINMKEVLNSFYTDTYTMSEDDVNLIRIINDSISFTKIYDIYKNGYNFGNINTENKYKTTANYYLSNLNFWLTNDDGVDNSDFDNYKYIFNQNDNNILPNNSAVETKGYFNNLLFIESAISRILYPKILEFSRGVYNFEQYWDTNGFLKDDIFKIDNEEKIYDQIFDSIINNSYVFTDRNVTGEDLDKFIDNYDLLTNRVLLNNNNKSVISKPNTLYEFITNSLIYTSKDTTPNGIRFMSKYEEYKSQQKFPTTKHMHRKDIEFYNVFINNIEKSFYNGNHVLKIKSPVYNSNQENTISYNFGNMYDPDENIFKNIIDTYFKNDNNDFRKIYYKNHKFFKLPIHNNGIDLNRSIKQINREILMDITNLSNYNISGISIEDFTYGEKALLEEYINEYKQINSLTNISDLEVLNLMLYELKNIKIMSVSSDFKAESSYFPDWLTIGDIQNIEALINRAITKINKTNKNIIYNSDHRQIETLYRNKSLSIPQEVKHDGKSSMLNVGNKIIIPSINGSFLKNIRTIIYGIITRTRDDSNASFKDINEMLTEKHKEGQWPEIEVQLNAMIDLLTNDEEINHVIEEHSLYNNTLDSEKDLLKNLDIGIYKLIIENYFAYIKDNTKELETNMDELNKILLTDNHENGIFRFYTDIINVFNFIEAYYFLIPKYVDYLNNNILNKYYSLMEAINKLPTWDYESFHLKDKERHLKTSAGINKHDYNFVWEYNKNQKKIGNNLRIIYKKPNNKSNYYISENIYNGGLSEQINRDKWFRKWMDDNGDLDGGVPVDVFKIPYVQFKDLNINVDAENWDSTNPTRENKQNLFSSMLNDHAYVEGGRIANLSSYKYAVNNKTVNKNNEFINIGVPIFIFDKNSHVEYNLANTIRKKSFSFEHNFLNMWFTDENWDNKKQWFENRTLTFITNKIVSLSDIYKNFGLGNINIEKLFDYFWNSHSTPLTTTYTVMNNEIFPVWSEGYDFKKDHFPWSTEQLNGRLYSNKYLMNYKLLNKTINEKKNWSKIILGGEISDYLIIDGEIINSIIKVPKDEIHSMSEDITNEQINSNIYWPSVHNVTNLYDNLRAVVNDVWNRNFKNRITISLFDWRNLIKNNVVYNISLYKIKKDTESILKESSANVKLVESTLSNDIRIESNIDIYDLNIVESTYSKPNVVPDKPKVSTTTKSVGTKSNSTSSSGSVKTLDKIEDTWW